GFLRETSASAASPPVSYSSLNLRAHSCASPQAAMSPINFSRRTVLRNTMRPAASTPCTVNADFARSTPTVVISFMTSPPGSDWTDEIQSWHLDAVSRLGKSLLFVRPGAQRRQSFCPNLRRDRLVKISTWWLLTTLSMTTLMATACGDPYSPSTGASSEHDNLVGAWRSQ